MDCVWIFSYTDNLEEDLKLDEDELRNNITLKYMELPKAVRIYIGHQLSEDQGMKGLLISCSFIGENCKNARQEDLFIVCGIKIILIHSLSAFGTFPIILSMATATHLMQFTT